MSKNILSHVLFNPNFSVFYQDFFVMGQHKVAYNCKVEGKIPHFTNKKINYMACICILARAGQYINNNIYRGRHVIDISK